jgi:hypothetical protein
MIAAVYARKSNEQQGVADEAKSVARQIAHARAYAEKKGWTVPDEHYKRAVLAEDREGHRVPDKTDRTSVGLFATGATSGTSGAGRPCAGAS